jgi:caffeoyl-CoA O-methyltransferase
VKTGPHSDTPLHPAEMLDYCEAMSSAEPIWLATLSRLTHLRHTHARQLSGHLQGRMLAMISKLIQPKLVIDIGAFTGYSALCLAEGLAVDGKVVSIEANDENENIIREGIAASPYHLAIEPVIGDALSWLESNSTLRPDLLYLDADKLRYPQYLEKIIPMMNSGSVLLADNTLWNGKVVHSGFREKDADTRVMHAYNAAAHGLEGFDIVLLPLRDGLSILRKK